VTDDPPPRPPLRLPNVDMNAFNRMSDAYRARRDRLLAEEAGRVAGREPPWYVRHALELIVGVLGTVIGGGILFLLRWL
jgi:hypothetical protein